MSTQQNDYKCELEKGSYQSRRDECVSLGLENSFLHSEELGPRLLYQKDFQILSNTQVSYLHNIVLEKKVVKRYLEAWNKKIQENKIISQDHGVRACVFHPESILTSSGKKMITNFLEVIR